MQPGNKTSGQPLLPVEVTGQVETGEAGGSAKEADLGTVASDWGS